MEYLRPPKTPDPVTAHRVRNCTTQGAQTPQQLLNTVIRAKALGALTPWWTIPSDDAPPRSRLAEKNEQKLRNLKSGGLFPEVGFCSRGKGCLTAAFVNQRARQEPGRRLPFAVTDCAASELPVSAFASRKPALSRSERRQAYGACVPICDSETELIPVSGPQNPFAHNRE
jgi:hypothetical protein